MSNKSFVLTVVIILAVAMFASNLGEKTGKVAIAPFCVEITNEGQCRFSGSPDPGYKACSCSAPAICPEGMQFATGSYSNSCTKGHCWLSSSCTNNFKCCKVPLPRFM